MAGRLIDPHDFRACVIMGKNFAIRLSFFGQAPRAPLAHAGTVAKSFAFDGKGAAFFGDLKKEAAQFAVAECLAKFDAADCFFCLSGPQFNSVRAAGGGLFDDARVFEAFHEFGHLFGAEGFFPIDRRDVGTGAFDGFEVA